MWKIEKKILGQLNILYGVTYQGISGKTSSLCVLKMPGSVITFSVENNGLIFFPQCFSK